MALDDALEQFKAAANAFAQGDSGPMKALFSHRDDVTLANPFGPAVLGWQKVANALDYASSRFSDGEMTEIKTIARYGAPELVTFLDTEHWRTRVGAGELSDADLRVSTTYRNEDGVWRIAHRHADPIATFDDQGPLRKMS
jgi:ketosteroid isomerase-like protein